MFQYTICNTPDREIYTRQCKALEKIIRGIEKVYELHDVDDSQWTVYMVNGSEIKVSLNQSIGGVFVDSEIDLVPICKKTNKSFQLKKV